MRNLFTVFTALLLGSLAGCASVTMQDASLITPKEKMAIVNFVRPSIFFGDGLNVDIWDGPTFVGSMGAGKLIQHEVMPGKHLFLANAENWSYASGDLLAGKQYFIKVNLFPGVLTGRAALGVAKPDDIRIPDWLTSLKPTSATEKDRKDVGLKKRDEIQKAISEFETGKVSAFSRILPEDGR